MIFDQMKKIIFFKFKIIFKNFKILLSFKSSPKVLEILSTESFIIFLMKYFSIINFCIYNNFVFFDFSE